MLTSPRSHARAPHERNLALIIKMSISNWSPINSLHDLRLHFWKPWPNRREYRASSPKLSSTGVDEKISRRHAMWPQEPKLSPIKAASIPNDFPKRILQNSYSHLLFTTSFWFINRASRSKFNATFSAKTHLRDTRHLPSSPDVHLQKRWACQTEALFKSFKLDARSWDFVVDFLDKIRSSTPHFLQLDKVK